MESIERLTFICECYSLEHQVSFWYDEEDDVFFCEPHLYTYDHFFKRLWAGLKYAFGYKSRYGAWESTIFTKKDLKKLKDFLNKQKE